MTRSNWSEHQRTTAVTHLVTTYGRTCWLCHHPITTEQTISIDHVHPVHTHPELEHEPTNWRPAHLHPHGHPAGNGCNTPGCNCPGNTGRKHRPWTAPPSRTW